MVLAEKLDQFFRDAEIPKEHAMLRTVAQSAFLCGVATAIEAIKESRDPAQTAAVIIAELTETTGGPLQ